MIRRRKDAEGEARRRVMVRPFWSGTISFGLISVPVQLFPATRRLGVALRMLDEDGTPLKRRYLCPAHDRIVEADEIVRGYELDTGEHVIVTDEELEAAEPKKSREIDLQRFVALSAVPPLHFERAYFLTPSGDTTKAYRLLAEVMEATDRAGIASFVMRGKEYLVAILAEEGILRAETLRFADEIRDPSAAGLDEEGEADEEAVARLSAAIEALESDALDPREMENDHPDRVRALAESKREAGRDVVEAPAYEEAEEEEPEAPREEGEEEDLEEADLLETIRLSLRGEGALSERAGGERRSAATRPDEGALDNLPKNRLYERAQELDIEGRSKMTKATLIREIRRRWRR
jgi:DNA end-binding protein Ku